MKLLFRKIYIFVIVFLLALLPGSVAFAQEVSDPDFTDLRGILTWLAGVGAVMATNWLFGKVAEGIEAWNKLPTQVKWIVPPVFSILVGLVANWLLTQDALIAVVQPYWSLVAVIILGYFSSQVAHLQTKSPKG